MLLKHLCLARTGTGQSKTAFCRRKIRFYKGFVFLAQNLVVWEIVQSIQNSLLAVLKQCIFFTRDKTCVPQKEIKEWTILHIIKYPEKFTKYHSHRVAIKNISIMIVVKGIFSQNCFDVTNCVVAHPFSGYCGVIKSEPWLQTSATV